jgi:hypothetical protein
VLLVLCVVVGHIIKRRKERGFSRTLKPKKQKLNLKVQVLFLLILFLILAKRMKKLPQI